MYSLCIVAYRHCSFAASLSPCASSSGTTVAFQEDFTFLFGHETATSVSVGLLSMISTESFRTHPHHCTIHSHEVDRVLLTTVRLVVTLHVRPGYLCNLTHTNIIFCCKGCEGREVGPRCTHKRMYVCILMNNSECNKLQPIHQGKVTTCHNRS